MRKVRVGRLKAWHYLLFSLFIAVLAWLFIPGLGPNLARLDNLPLSDQFAIGGESTEELLKNAPQTSLTQGLASLPVQPWTHSPYNRKDFGPAWEDVDGNGCDTRNDILTRDLKNTAFRPGTSGCVVVSGSFVDPYTGRNIIFHRGPKSSEAVQIDHVVALGNAWHTGASSWDYDKRLRFANDPLVLLAVEGQANQDKESKDAASWLPPNPGFHCQYVALQVAIKLKYGLWVTAAEKHRMAQVASVCPSQKLPTF